MREKDGDWIFFFLESDLSVSRLYFKGQNHNMLWREAEQSVAMVSTHDLTHRTFAVGLDSDYCMFLVTQPMQMPIQEVIKMEMHSATVQIKSNLSLPLSCLL